MQYAIGEGPCITAAAEGMGPGPAHRVTIAGGGPEASVPSP
jgi:hypothetical protein